jgi:hypothetical protein
MRLRIPSHLLPLSMALDLVIGLGVRLMNLVSEPKDNAGDGLEKCWGVSLSNGLRLQGRMLDEDISWSTQHTITSSCFQSSK